MAFVTSKNRRPKPFVVAWDDFPNGFKCPGVDRLFAPKGGSLRFEPRTGAGLLPAFFIHLVTRERRCLVSEEKEQST